MKDFHANQDHLISKINESDKVIKDAKRYQYWKSRLLAVDFEYGDPPQCALVFRAPDNIAYSPDLDKVTDAAIMNVL